MLKTVPGRSRLDSVPVHWGRVVGPELRAHSVGSASIIAWLVLSMAGCGIVLGIEDDERMASAAGGVSGAADSPPLAIGGSGGEGSSVKTGGVAETGGAMIAGGGSLLGSGAGESGVAGRGGAAGGMGGAASGGVPLGGTGGAAGDRGAGGAPGADGGAGGDHATGGLDLAGMAGASNDGGTAGKSDDGTAGSGEAAAGGPSMGGSGGIAGEGVAGGAGRGAPECDPSRPFGAHVPMDALNTEAGEGPARVTADGKALYFTRGTFDWSELRVASRESVSDPFDSSTLLASTVEAATTGVYAYSGVSVTEDQLTMVFGCYHLGSGWDVCTSTRTTTLGSWSAPQGIGSVNTNDPEMDPSIRFDGLELFFARGTPGEPAFIMVATRLSTTEEFGEPVAVAALSEGGDRSPVLSHDGLTLYFSSVRTNERAQGWLDIWKTNRPSLEGDWEPPIIVPDLSSRYEDTLGSVTADGCTAYLSQAEPDVRWADLLETKRCDCP